jgi:hypothetical protein
MACVERPIFNSRSLSGQNCGLQVLTSLCLLLFFYLSSNTGLGNSRTPQNFCEWKGSCKVCGKAVQGLQGIFCGNFDCYRGGWTPCRNAWCGDCYMSLPGDDFHVHLPQDEEGFVWVKRGDENRFKCGRAGDHLVPPFECDLCVFRKLKGRDPVPSSHHDEYLKVVISRRPTLLHITARR